MYHLPGSPGRGDDDKVMASLDTLCAVPEVVATEKMDGENTTIHAGGCHARSLDTGAHPARDWVRGFAASISPQLAPGERIVGECLYARHSVAYDALPSWFLGFAWIQDEAIASWDDTLSRFAALGITPVPTLARGAFANDLLARLIDGLDTQRQEGFVIRDARAFPEAEMLHRMGKYVRAGHVAADARHWSRGPIMRNGLA